MKKQKKQIKMIIDDQGGAVINILKKEVSPTIRAQMGGHPPLVMETFINEDGQQRALDAPI